MKSIESTFQYKQITEEDLQEILFIFHNGYLKDEEPKILYTFKAVASSTNLKMKRLLAKNIASSIRIPKDIIYKLAYDHLKVSYHVLLLSPILTEEDLINIIKDTKDIGRLRVVAMRPSISSKLAEFILAFNDTIATANLEKNNNSIITSTTKHLITPEFSKLHFFEIEFSELSNTQEYKDAATIVNSVSNPNYTLMLRYLCKGDLLTFFLFLSRITNIPISSLKAIFSDSSNEEEQEILLKKAGIHGSYIPIILRFFEVILVEKGTLTESNFKNHMIQKLSRFKSKGTELNYFISLIK